jgi:hypothetical protein
MFSDIRSARLQCKRGYRCRRSSGSDHLATTEIYLNFSPEHVIKEFIDEW